MTHRIVVHATVKNRGNDPLDLSSIFFKKKFQKSFQIFEMNAVDKLLQENLYTDIAHAIECGFLTPNSDALQCMIKQTADYPNIEKVESIIRAEIVFVTESRQSMNRMWREKRQRWIDGHND